MIDPANSTTGQADEVVQYNFKKRFYDSNKNVKAAVISGLNLLIPSTYRGVNGGRVRTRLYWTTDDSRDLIREFRRLYVRLSPKENGHGYHMERAMEHIDAHRTLLQRVRGNVCSDY